MSGKGAPIEAWPIPGRPWPDSVRETSLDVWDVNDDRDWTRVRKLPEWRL
jgi:hypothetical protein